MTTCSICHENEATQDHHISYTPDIKVDTCVPCHEEEHKHGVGTPRGVSREGYPHDFIGVRRVVKIGGSYYISIPPKWLKAHNLDPKNLELLQVANKDIRIVNPEHREAVYNEVSQITKEAKI